MRKFRGDPREILNPNPTKLFEFNNSAFEIRMPYKGYPYFLCVLK